MPDNFAISFRERFSRAYEHSDFSSHRALSMASGWSPARINQILAGHFDDSATGPGFFGVVRACEQLGITPDYLAGIERWREHRPEITMNALSLVNSVSGEMDRPNIAELIRLYVRSGQRLEAFSNHLDHCDIYEEPDNENRRVTVRSVGNKSLSSLRMGVPNAAVLQEAYDRASSEFQEKIFSSHERAFLLGMTVEPDAIDERMENRPVHVKIDYSRVAMKLTDKDGINCLLVFCELIPQ